MKQEVTVKTGTPIDFKNVRPPKFKINEQAYLLYFGEVIKVDIIGVELQLKWFDNAYISRYEWTIKYELSVANKTTPWFQDQFEEHMLFKNLADVTLEAKKYALEKFVKRKEDLEQSIKDTERNLLHYQTQYQELLK